MSSTNKTSLGLNLWLGGDKPKREDFCSDNTIIDKAITTHTADEVSHICAQERENWNNYIYTGVYYGDGQTYRSIETGCPFEPRAVLVFANGVPVHVRGSDNDFYYTAYGTGGGSTMGLSLLNGNKTLRVLQSTSAVIEKITLALMKTESGIVISV